MGSRWESLVRGGIRIAACASGGFETRREGGEGPSEGIVGNMRFIHTADWQIGMKAAHVGSAGERVRAERLEACRRVMKLAQQHEVDFVVLAGDTFEDNAVGRVTVRQVGDLLGGAAIPVYVLPGNHDPLVPGSVWEHPVWEENEQIHVLRAAEPVPIGNVVLYPCPAFEQHSGGDPTLWIPGNGEGIRIGVAHGTVEGLASDDRSFPIARDAAEARALDYLALGHWHSTALYETATGGVRTAYSGTHEATRFGERDSGNVLLVEISGPGQPPQVQKVPTGGLTWLRLDLDVRTKEDLLLAAEQIEGIENPSSTLLDLKIRGLLNPSGLDVLARIGEIMEARFLFYRLDDDDLHPHAEDPSWMDALPSGLLREVAQGLMRLSDPEHAVAGSDHTDPQVAARALEELHALARQEAGGTGSRSVSEVPES